LGSSRIIKTPMQLDVSSGIGRARCIGVMTDGNDVVEMSSLEFGNVLRAMARSIHSQLSHHLDRSRSIMTRPSQNHFKTFYIDVNVL
jgi:hypothetical protein